MLVHVEHTSIYTFNVHVVCTVIRVLVLLLLIVYHNCMLCSSSGSGGCCPRWRLQQYDDYDDGLARHGNSALPAETKQSAITRNGKAGT